MKKTKRIMNHAPRSAARPSRARIAVCASNGKCVPGKNLVSGTQHSVINQTLNSMCAMCAGCASFFNLIQRFLENTVLFSKKNFNLKLPGTHGTHLYNPRNYSLFTFCYLAQRVARTWHKHPCTWHTSGK